MSQESLSQGSQYGHPLLAQRREIAANAAEGLSTSSRAETAGDLLLHFDHPNIAFGQAVVKRDRKIVQEGEHRLRMLGEAIQQIARRRLFASTFLAALCWWIGRRVGQIALGGVPVVNGQKPTLVENLSVKDNSSTMNYAKQIL